MNNWNLCSVKYIKIDEQTGKEKKVTEPYLVDAINYTDAEATFTMIINEIVTGEYSITGIKPQLIHDLIESASYLYWYKAKIKMLVGQEDGTTKEQTQIAYVSADSIKQATENIDKYYSDMMLEFRIHTISETKVVDVFPYVSEH